MFAIVNMMRITGAVISKNSKMCRTNSNFEKFENTVNLISNVCAMSEMMISTMFAIVNIMRITGLIISKKSKCVQQTAISKSLKTL